MLACLRAWQEERRLTGPSPEPDDERGPLPRSTMLLVLSRLACANSQPGKEDEGMAVTVLGHRHDNKTRQVGQVGREIGLT